MYSCIWVVAKIDTVMYAENRTLHDANLQPVTFLVSELHKPLHGRCYNCNYFDNRSRNLISKCQYLATLTIHAAKVSMCCSKYVSYSGTNQLHVVVSTRMLQH